MPNHFNIDVALSLISATLVASQFFAPSPEVSANYKQAENAMGQLNDLLKKIAEHAKKTDDNELLAILETQIVWS